MSRVDRVKREIAFHEKMLLAALAVILVLIDWIVGRYQNVSVWILVFVIMGLESVCFFGIHQYRRIKRLLSELEKC